MRTLSNRSLVLLIFQFILLVTLKLDQAFSFRSGGPSIIGNGRSAIARSRKKFANPPTGNLNLDANGRVCGRKSYNDSQLNAVMDIVGVSPEPIHSAFAFATFGPQPFWLLMILLPGNDLTKKIMGKMGKKRCHLVAPRNHFIVRLVQSTFGCVFKFRTLAIL